MTAATVQNPTVPDYEIIGSLGKGGFSQVVKAKREDTLEEVALKIIRPGKDPIYQENEAKVLSSLGPWSEDHHIVQLRCSFKGADGSTILEFPVYKQSLWERKGCSLGLVQSFTEQVLKAIRFIHSRGVIHADIKPGNCFVDQFDHVYLGDFGAAFHTSGAWPTGAIGSFPYMSRELLEWGKENPNAPPFSKGSDMWALGVLLHTLIQGRTFIIEKIPRLKRAQEIQEFLEKRDQNLDGLVANKKDYDRDDWNVLRSVLQNTLVDEPKDRMSADELLSTVFSRLKRQSPLEEIIDPKRRRIQEPEEEEPTVLDEEELLTSTQIPELSRNGTQTEGPPVIIG